MPAALPPSTRHVALLRGINVGGNRRIPMAALRACFEALGFANVKTLLASGNVVFDVPKACEASLTPMIEAHLERTFGFATDVILRPVAHLRRMIEASPFKDITVTPETRRYVTFLRESPTATLEIPYASADGDFRILQASWKEVFSVVMVSRPGRSGDAMSLLEKIYGRRITTRNWNTVERIAAA
ncbi:MAG: DUF1697 domain-containing protein [Gemmatimonadota bacterium]